MLLSKRAVIRSSFLALWALVMTTITVVLGAPPLRILRLVVGRSLYWVSVIGMGLVLFGIGWKALAIFFVLIAMLVGVYSELLENAWTPLSSSAVSLAMTSLAGGAAFLLWTVRQGQGWFARLTETVQSSFGQSPLLNGGIKLSVEDLLLQAPSGFLLLLIVASALLLVMEPRLREWAGQKSNSSITYLKDFRLPDVFVWLTIAALLGSFAKTDVRWAQVVGMNLLNICVLLYFFQGLAVIVRFFDVMKVSPFWRTVWLVLMVLQLFLVVSIIGLIDYWMDFRHRLKGKSEQINKTL